MNKVPFKTKRKGITNAIKTAKADGDKEQVKQLQQQLTELKRNRHKKEY